jgi:hypothetical protein
MEFPYGAPQPPNMTPQQQHHPTPVQPPMNVPQQQPPNAPTPQQQQQHTPTQTPAPAPPRQRKRPAPSAGPPPSATAPPPAPGTPAQAQQTSIQAPPVVTGPAGPQIPAPVDDVVPVAQPPAKKSRTNTPWTPQEELRLKQMRDAGNSWAEIAKTFPSRTEGSVKKHWYKDMHYAEFAEDESQALLNAIKDYENNKWKTIGQKVGKPAKACEQYAKEHFPELFGSNKNR